MPGRFLVDTNILVAALNDEQMVQIHLDEADQVWLCAPVLAELFFGARKSGRSEPNLRRVEVLAVKYSVLNCDADTARFFGLIKNELRSQGRPIPENDVWIAAIALQHDLTLVTRDAHFGAVANLKTQSW